MTTIADHIHDRDEIRIYCLKDGCRHHGPLDLVAIGIKIGFYRDVLAPDILPHIRCGKCGGRELTLRHQSGATPPYMGART